MLVIVQSILLMQVGLCPRPKNSFAFYRKKGYREERQTGSQRILKHPTLPMLVVPFRRGDIPRGLFLRILKDGGFTEKDFKFRVRVQNSNRT